MNISYLSGAMSMLIILGYAYIIFVKAKVERGATRITGLTISGLLVIFVGLLNSSL